MAKKMQAMFVEHLGKPLVSMEVDVPTPGSSGETGSGNRQLEQTKLSV